MQNNEGGSHQFESSLELRVDTIVWLHVTRHGYHRWLMTLKSLMHEVEALLLTPNSCMLWGIRKTMRFMYEYSDNTSLTINIIFHPCVCRYSLTLIIQHSIIWHFDCTMHFPSAKLSSVDLPWYYNYDTRITIFLGSFCHIIEVINAMHVVGSTLRGLPWDQRVYGDFINELT